MQRIRTLHFHETDNEGVICYSKSDGEDLVLVVVNIDPHGVRETTIRLDLPVFGLGWQDTFVVQDQLTGATFNWAEHNYVRLDPFQEPAHILTIRQGGRGASAP